MSTAVLQDWYDFLGKILVQDDDQTAVDRLMVSKAARSARYPGVLRNEPADAGPMPAAKRI